MELSSPLYDEPTIEVTKTIHQPLRTYGRRKQVGESIGQTATSLNRSTPVSQATYSRSAITRPIPRQTALPKASTMAVSGSAEPERVKQEPTGHILVKQESGEYIVMKQESAEYILVKQETPEEEEVAADSEKSLDLVEGQTYYACPVCMSFFEQMDEAQRHFDCHREGSDLFHCTEAECTASSESWPLMEQHLEAHDVAEAEPPPMTDAPSTPSPSPPPPPPVSSPLPLPAKSVFHNRSQIPCTKRIRPVDFVGKEPLGCPFCLDDRFSDQEEINFHLECHKRDEDLLYCPFCETVAVTWVLLQSHLVEHEEVPQQITRPSDNRICPTCAKILDSEEDLIQHCESFHSDKKEITCDVCQVVSPDCRQYLEHRLTHDNLSFECSECQVLTRTMKAMEEHQKIHQGVGFVCSNCNVVLSEGHVELHKATCGRSVEQLTCSFCRRKLRGATAHLFHNQHFHEELLKRWPCAKCRYVGRSRKGLQLHAERVHNKPYNCADCSYACLTEHTMTRHRHLFHSGQGDGPLPCPRCSHLAHDRDSLAHHMHRTHRQGPDAFPCPVCDASFRTQVLLNDHMLSHAGGREEFACRLCIFSAKYRPALYRHILNKHPGVTLSAAILRVTEKPVKRRADSGEVGAAESPKVQKTRSILTPQVTARTTVAPSALVPTLVSTEAEAMDFQGTATEEASTDVETAPVDQSANFEAPASSQPIEMSLEDESANGDEASETPETAEPYFVDADGLLTSAGDSSSGIRYVLCRDEGATDEDCEIFVISEERLAQILSTQ